MARTGRFLEIYKSDRCRDDMVCCLYPFSFLCSSAGLLDSFDSPRCGSWLISQNYVNFHCSYY